MAFGIKRTPLDTQFSLYIRNRAGWKCERCGTQYPKPHAGLHCSHFHGRGKKSVRFDEDNAASLDFGCHQKMGADPVAHCDFFMKRLGQKRYDALTIRANTPGKPDQKMLMIKYKMLNKAFKEKEEDNDDAEKLLKSIREK